MPRSNEIVRFNPVHALKTLPLLPLSMFSCPTRKFSSDSQLTRRESVEIQEQSARGQAQQVTCVKSLDQEVAEGEKHARTPTMSARGGGHVVQKLLLYLAETGEGRSQHGGSQVRRASERLIS
ncbi:hypothetical protein HOY82DRAFT_541207 [Tuber indicum]|nr:hypothetical protein HOY82DRAFT_541207 [Tuber indicum]